jgi:tetratricopeptide (TPR) repeat protein
MNNRLSPVRRRLKLRLAVRLRTPATIRAGGLPARSALQPRLQSPGLCPRHPGSTPNLSSVLPFLSCIALCIAPPLARGAETQTTPAPKLSEIKPASPPAEKSTPPPEPKTSAPATPTKKPSENPAPGHAFDSAAGAVENIRPIGTQTAALATLLESLKKGEITPAAAFQSGQMTGAQALELLADTTIGTLQYRPLVHDLAEVVANKAPELIADVEKVAPQAKLRLAPYFLEVRDPRAVPFYESILAAIPQPPRDQDALPVFKLSDYYAAIGDYKKAAETRERMKDYTTNPKFLANSEIETARFYQRMGEEEKAQKNYDGVSRHGYGWATGLVLYDRASALVDKGKHQEARELLMKSVEGEYADQIKVFMLSLLGYSCYRTDEFEKAKKFAEAAIAQYKSLNPPLQREGLENQVFIAEQCLHWIEQRKKYPIVCDPDELNVVVNRREKPFVWEVLVRTFQPVPLVVTCNDDRIKIRIEDQVTDLGYFFEVYVHAEVASSSVVKSLDTILEVSSPRFPNFKTQVPLHIKGPEY